MLRELNHEVLEIPATVLDDKDRMSGLFYRLARLLMGRKRAQGLCENTRWLDSEPRNR